jgi:two-component system, sensor histidine kinase PdtaS
MQMHRRILYFLLTLFSVFTAQAQISGLTPRLPALLSKLRSLPPDTEKLNTLLSIADHYLFAADVIGQDDSAELYLKQAVTLNSFGHNYTANNHILLLRAYIKEDTTSSPAPLLTYSPIITLLQKNKDKANERLAWRLLADATHDPSFDTLKISYYQIARRLAADLGDVEDELDSRISIAKVHLDQRKLELSKTELQQAVLDSKNRPRNLHTAYSMLATLYFNHGRMDSALFCALRSERIQMQTGDTTYITNDYNILSNTYYALGQDMEGMFWAKKVIQHCRWTHKTNFILPVTNGIISQLLKQGKAKEALAFMDEQLTNTPLRSARDNRFAQKIYGAIHAALKQYELAESNYRQALRFGRSEGQAYESGDRASDVAALGLLYYRTKKFVLAKIYLDTALSIYQLSARQDVIGRIHKRLSEVDSALGNFASAYQHLTASNKILDSIFSKERDRKLEELSFQYKSEEKEKDLILMKNEQLLAHEQLLHTRTIRDWIIAAFILLLVIAALLTRQSHISRKTNAIIIQKNALLERLLSEKEWLLKEVHHRVKNNLHTILSLLESQAAYLNEDALHAIENSQHRVYAMSLVHQKLYQGTDLRTIDMNIYLPEFVQYLADSFGRPINIHIRTVIDPIVLDVSKAIAVGMITNEAVTNSFKYAFPHQRQGEIDVHLTNKEGNITLSIADDGVGMMLQGSNSEVNSLGIELMKGLARDLDGKIQFDNRLGTIIKVTFMNEPAVPEHLHPSHAYQTSTDNES